MITMIKGWRGKNDLNSVLYRVYDSGTYRGLEVEEMQQG